MKPPAISPAFHDVSRQSQAVFRAIMQAMAQPGRTGLLDTGFETPAPLAPGAAAILLTLADFETPLWLDATLSASPATTDYLRFHTGASLVSDPQSAAFALIADAERAPPLTAFSQGTPDYPDRSTTLVFQVGSLDGQDWRLAGPGIKGETVFGVSPLPAGFMQQLQENNACAPLGVDVLFASQTRIAAIPRSTRIMEAR
ncbi:MAG: phosphonate C-P lyase system protein PhnH [Hyphomicrobiales bacterium]|nr:phosphonate C-P lyase system protein PhnH [Hyphomicrobiales bacterium]